VIPYADFLSLGLSLYLSGLAVIAGLFARLRRTRFWIVAVGAVTIAILYAGSQTLWRGTTAPILLIVALYAALQYSIAAVWLVVRRRGKSQRIYVLAIALSLAPLLAVKLGGLLAASDVLGFLGISYLTFRGLDVIIGIQDGLITDLPVLQYLAFLLFFPTLSAGPVDRYRRFAKDWSHDRTRAEFMSDLDSAIQRLFRGLLYKFILAALIKQYWMDPAAQGAGLWSTWSYMYAYSFYLFFDFAGYSAFAIAFSYVFGIHTPENFNRPFQSHSIREFWDRWHISLSWWFRDHVYMRFVLTATRAKWFKDARMASYLGFVCSMGLMGMWHGLTWYYIVYGLYHAALLIGHDLFSRWNKKRQLLKGPWWQAASIAVTFNAVCFGLLLFSGHLA
jgi:membrane protein involved in D-alanine export